MIGYQKSTHKRPGHLVKAFICFSDGGEEEIRFGSTGGKYVTEILDKNRGRCWFLARKQLSEKDSIRLEVFTGYKNLGQDGGLTGKRIYVLDPSVEIREYRFDAVGPREYPLIKGRLLELASITVKQEMESDIQQFLADEDGM